MSISYYEQTITKVPDSKRSLVAAYLQDYITEDRLKRMHDVLEYRTQKISVVLEDIYQTHNASAVLRSCDAFGIQDVYVIENRNRLRVSEGISRKANQWLSLYRFTNSDEHIFNLSVEEAKKFTNRKLRNECYSALRKKGYKLVATSPHAECTLTDLNLSQPLALLFGTEREGLDDEAIGEADYRIKIPMYGFSESFNISVTVALCLRELTGRLRSEYDASYWQLNHRKKQEVLTEWLINTVKNSDKLIDRFIDK
ncbi:MAG: RNA methyltransferase [Balneolales bacterium]|nr:RNA methyltransferase [Balneolales bacterium]